VSQYDAVLFDSDGVLVAPPARETQTAATRAAFEEVGVAEPDRQHVDEVVDGTTVEGLQAICASYGVDPREFWAAREHHDEQSQFEAFRAGSRERYDDVTAIRELPQACGVVSNNHHTTIEFVLEYFELGDLFETYHGREKTVESLGLKKPNTHYLDSALAALDADTALYVGDSEHDLVAAHRAGLDSAFLRRPHCRDTSLSVEPTYETDDLRGLVNLVGV
jgi:HAD superfamily hydrolase (TIGR01549 family)